MKRENKKKNVEKDNRGKSVKRDLEEKGKQNVQERPVGGPPGDGTPGAQRALWEKIKAPVIWAAVTAIVLFLGNLTGIPHNIITTYQAAMQITYDAQTATAGGPAQTATAQELATQKAAATAQGLQTQQGIYTAVADTATVIADQVDLNANYFCSRVADLTSNTVSAEFGQWLFQKGISHAQTIKSPYWNRAAGEANREYLFIAFVNHGIKLDFTNISDTTWLPTDREPQCWADKDAITGYGKIQTDSAFALLVADRRAETPAFVFPTNPPVSSGDPPLSGSSLLSPGSLSSIPIISCGEPASWGIEKIAFSLTYDPDGTLPATQLQVNLSDEPGAILELIDQ